MKCVLCYKRYMYKRYVSTVTCILHDCKTSLILNDYQQHCRNIN